MPDRRILYSRWEYVDRQFRPSFGRWTCHPDGTAHSLIYGNNARTPGSIVDGHVIPGTGLVLCVFGACHDLPSGAPVIVDRRRGMDGSSPVVRIWPAWTRKWLENQRNDEWNAHNIDLFAGTHPKYEDPWPLSEKYFLASRTFTEDTSRSMRMGIFLVDVFGNELLLHWETPRCYDPMPLATCPRPPMIGSRTDSTAAVGTFYVRDVYVGTGMEQAPHGSIRWLRIIEAPPQTVLDVSGVGEASTPTRLRS
jgi:hypothetical protein